MKITIEAIEKIKTLDTVEFRKRFEEQGLQAGKISEQLFMELSAMWVELRQGCTARTVFDKWADGAWIPAINGYEKI